jgi:large subunit ribosomal protein L10
MNRDEKSATIEEIAAQIEASEAIFAVDYKGISVPQAAELRAKLRESDASFRIVKNRLSKIAAGKAGEERLDDLLKGPTALTFVRGDTAQAAKTISSFSKENDVLTFKGGFMEGLSLDEDRFKAIAKLPGREVLIGQFAGVVASPLTGLVRGLGALIQGLASQLGQIADQGLVSGEAPTPAPEAAPEPVADEQPAADEQPPGEVADAGPADAPIEEAPTESSAGNEPPAGGDPSKPEGEDDETAQADQPPADETSEDTTSNDDASKEEE